MINNDARDSHPEDTAVNAKTVSTAVPVHGTAADPELTESTPPGTTRKRPQLKPPRWFDWVLLGVDTAWLLGIYYLMTISLFAVFRDIAPDDQGQALGSWIGLTILLFVLPAAAAPSLIYGFIQVRRTLRKVHLAVIIASFVPYAAMVAGLIHLLMN